jgi:hypothetical protein
MAAARPAQGFSTPPGDDCADDPDGSALDAAELRVPFLGAATMLARAEAQVADEPGRRSP